MRNPVSPTASDTPDEPTTGAAPGPAAPPRDFPVQRGCPFPAPAGYAAMRTGYPVARVTLPTKREAWVVTRYDDVRELLSDPRVSADIRRPNFPALGEGEQEAGARLRPFIRTDAPEHTRYRRMLLPVFTVRRVRAMRPAVQARVDEILLAAGGPERIGQHLARLELDVALETLIRRVPTLRLAADRDRVAVKHDSATFGLEELMVIW